MAGKGATSKLEHVLAALQGEGKFKAALDVTTLEQLRKRLHDDPSRRPKGARRVWDEQTPGLHLRVMPSGTMSFNVQWSRKGVKSLGKFPIMTLDGARKQAKLALASAAESADRIPDIARPKRVADTLTLEQFVEKYYRPHAKRHLAHGDADADRILRVLHKAKGKPLATISAKSLQAILDARDVEPGTLARDRNTVRAALNLAVKWGMLEHNPAVGLETGKVKDDATRYLSADEEAALVAALEARDDATRKARARTLAGRRKQHAGLRAISEDAYSDHLAPLVLTALHTGCRRGELFKLRWSDVHLEGNPPQVTIRGATAKSGKTRHIPLNGTAAAALGKWREQNPGTGLVFGLVDVKKAWAGLLEAAKIEAFRFHDLRHTFASKLVQRGVPLNTVRELLGHADIKMTLRYAHLAPENKAAAVALLDQAPARDNVTPIRRKA